MSYEGEAARPGPGALGSGVQRPERIRPTRPPPGHARGRHGFAPAPPAPAPTRKTSFLLFAQPHAPMVHGPRWVRQAALGVALGYSRPPSGAVPSQGRVCVANAIGPHSPAPHTPCGPSRMPPVLWRILVTGHSVQRGLLTRPPEGLTRATSFGERDHAMALRLPAARDLGPLEPASTSIKSILAPRPLAAVSLLSQSGWTGKKRSSSSSSSASGTWATCQGGGSQQSWLGRAMRGKVGG